MASSTSFECATCHKALGTFICRGCERNFCLSHVSEHRQALAMQMDHEIIPLHDQLQENLDDDHRLMNEINEWEIHSIEKIHRTADDARRELRILMTKHAKTFKEELHIVTEQLKQARKNDQFFENDLKEWMKKLNELANHFVTIQQKITIEYDSMPSLISIHQRTDLSDESFQQAIGNIHVVENGSVIVHNQTNNYASVRGQRHYSQGQHQVRFQIEHLTNHWVFFGIVSKDAPIPDYPCIGKTAFGWSGLNDIWRNGIQTTEHHGYRSDFEINDRIILLINCDHKFIQLTNERIGIIDTLNIDMNECPLPWKLSVGLYHSPGERIRLL